MAQSGVGPTQAKPRLSMRKGFAWNLGGTSLYNLSQWLLLLVLARLADPVAVGSFSLILATSAPIFLTIGMNLRAVVATDANRRWRLEEYLLLRQLLNAVAILTTMVAGLALGIRGWALAALAVVSVAKSLEAGSQVFYGYFQLRERLDLVTRSLWARAVSGPILFLIAFSATHQLAVAALGLVIGWGAAQFLLDQPNARRLAREEGRPLQSFRTARINEVKALARKAAPLGLDQGVSSLSTNIPRYLIKGLLGTAHLGVYASQAYLAQVIQMTNTAIATVFIPRMATSYHRGQRRVFVRMLLQLVLFGIFVLACGLAFGVVFGNEFIRLTLGPAYVNQSLLLALMAGVGVTTLKSNLCNGLTASHAFGRFLLVDCITTGGILASAVPLIKMFGVVGAAYSIIVGSAAGTVAASIAVVGVMRRMPEPNTLRTS